MNRFDRLVTLRRIREESEGMAFGRIAANMAAMRQRIQALDHETEQGRQMAMQGIATTDRLPPGLCDDFFKGQQWRRSRMDAALAEAHKEADAAREKWHTARVSLKQAEKLAERETTLKHEERALREKKEMDMVGILQNSFYNHQEETR